MIYMFYSTVEGSRLFFEKLLFHEHVRPFSVVAQIGADHQVHARNDMLKYMYDCTCIRHVPVHAHDRMQCPPVNVMLSTHGNYCLI